MRLSHLNWFMVILCRWCGYLLFFFILLYFVSGFGRTMGIIDPVFAKTLHERWLPVPTFATFLLHSLINIKIVILRKGIRDRFWWNVYLIILGLVLLGAFLYIYLR